METVSGLGFAEEEFDILWAIFDGSKIAMSYIFDKLYNKVLNISLVL